MNYYDRIPNPDGSFMKPEDSQSESFVADLLEHVWNCECRSFGRKAPVDWYFTRAGCLVGVGELKTRPHESTTYPTVFLNVRKWLALQLASIGLGVPAVFVVRLQDGIFWIDLTAVDASHHRIGGCTRIVKSRSDIEPVIEVPIDQMKTLRKERP